MRRLSPLVLLFLAVAPLVAQTPICTQRRGSGLLNKSVTYAPTDSGTITTIYVSADTQVDRCTKVQRMAAKPAPTPVPVPPPVDTQPAPLPLPPGPASFYFNSAEPGCGSDPTVLLCDDFEDGVWYEKDCDQANASGGLLQTDGWCGTIYSKATGPAARCGNSGFRSNCTASTGVWGTGTGAHQADHTLANGGAADLWVRFYTKPSTGYVFGQEKWLTFNAGQAGSGGIRWGNLMWNCGSDGSSSAGATMHFNPPIDACLPSANSNQRYSMTGGNWYFVETHYRLNTPGQADGLFEMWIDNCGPSGTSCPATPTLRYRNTAVLTDRQAGEKISALWFQAWSEPISQGERLIDQVKVATVGPIGFMK